MFSVEGTKIELSRGDTGAVRISNLSGYTFSAADRALFTIKNGRGQVVYQHAYELTSADEENGAFTVSFTNGMTDDQPAGNYTWDVRYIITPYYDESDPPKIVDGAQVITPLPPQKLVLIDTVGQI